MSEGLFLYNPFGSIFTDEKVLEDAAQTSAQALESKPSLPEEIKQHVGKFIGQDSPIEELTEAPTEPTQNLHRLEVVSLFHLDPDQHKEAERLLQEATQRACKAEAKQWDGQIFIHKWKPHLSGDSSRRHENHQAIFGEQLGSGSLYVRVSGGASKISGKISSGQRRTTKFQFFCGVAVS